MARIAARRLGQAPEQLALQLQVLGRRLDHQLAPRQVLEQRPPHGALDAPPPPPRRPPPSPRPLEQRLAEPRRAARRAPRRRVVQVGLEPPQARELRDPAPIVPAPTTPIRSITPELWRRLALVVRRARATWRPLRLPRASAMTCASRGSAHSGSCSRQSSPTAACCDLVRPSPVRTRPPRPQLRHPSGVRRLGRPTHDQHLLLARASDMGTACPGYSRGCAEARPPAPTGRAGEPRCSPSSKRAEEVGSVTPGGGAPRRPSSRPVAAKKPQRIPGGPGAPARRPCRSPGTRCPVPHLADTRKRTGSPPFGI